MRNEADLSNNLRLSAFDFMTLILKLLAVPLYETMLSEVRKIYRILNNQFPHKRRNPVNKIHQYNIYNILCGYRRCKTAVDSVYCEGVMKVVDKK